MSDQNLETLKSRIAELEEELALKQNEVILYQRELIKFSQNLDLVLSSAQRDSELLKELQRALVPTEYPQFPGFEISRKFIYGTKTGGDYFDIFTQKDKMFFGVLLASSSSYTMSANFLSVILNQHHLLDGSNEKSVLQTVEILSTELKKSAKEGEETHLLYAQVNRRSMTMTFSCLGAITGFVQSPDSPLRVISSSGHGIRAGKKEEITEIELSLDPNMRLCFCSQGLVDVLDTHDMADVLNQTENQDVHELRNQMFIQAQVKSGLDHPVKDQTVIVIEVKDNILKISK